MFLVIDSLPGKKPWLVQVMGKTLQVGRAVVVVSNIVVVSKTVVVSSTVVVSKTVVVSTEIVVVGGIATQSDTVPVNWHIWPIGHGLATNTPWFTKSQIYKEKER
jgi:hypothetical protein